MELNEKILVTGGAGFIGSHLVDALLEDGNQVRVLDNLEPQVHGNLRENGQTPPYLNPEAEFILGDIRDLDCINRALRGIDIVFHQAAMVGVGQSMYEITKYTDVNTRGTAILLQCIIDAHDRPRKLVVASSMSIYGEGAYNCPIHGRVYPILRSIEQLSARDWELHCPVEGCGKYVSACPTVEDKPLNPTSIYAINKRDHEEMFLVVGRAYSIPTVALRYFNVYGPRQALSNPYTGVAAIFSSRLLNGNPPVIYEDGHQARDFVHVSDIVQANLIAMNNEGMDYGVFNVGSGRAITVLEVAQILTRYFEHESLEKSILFPPEISQQFRAGDIRHCYPDISNLTTFGYHPQVQFEDGISELIGWILQQTSNDSFEQARQELTRRGLAA